MEDFSATSFPKRAPPQRLFDYFSSLGENSKYVLEQQTNVQLLTRDWLDISPEEQDAVKDKAFEVPDVACLSYPEEMWGDSVVRISFL
jgi:hypothetical protein